MGAALLVTADEDSGVVEVEVDTLVVNKMSLEGDAALEVIEVDAALDSNEVLTGVDTEATDVWIDETTLDCAELEAAGVLVTALEAGMLEEATFVPDETAPVEEDAGEETAELALDNGAVETAADEVAATLEEALVVGADVAILPDAAVDCVWKSLAHIQPEIAWLTELPGELGFTVDAAAELAATDDVLCVVVLTVLMAELWVEALIVVGTTMLDVVLTVRKVTVAAWPAKVVVTTSLESSSAVTCGQSESPSHRWRHIPKHHRQKKKNV
jgi:hypothetical protein